MNSLLNFVRFAPLLFFLITMWFCICLQNFYQYFRDLSTASFSSAKDTPGLKLLVTSGYHAQRAVGIWLFTSAAWVFSMVVLGGVTRLTRSGLSMTDWKFTGSLPPLSDEAWVVEFDKYKQSPEYQRWVHVFMCMLTLWSIIAIIIYYLDPNKLGFVT